MMQPPHLAQKLLKWYAGRANIEDLQGDLDEVYLQERTNDGKWKADAHYWRQVLSLLFSYGLKKRKKGASYSNFYHKNSMDMFRNYFKLAYRNLSKQKTFTMINVVGLSIGMSIALLAVAMYIDLKQFDTWHTDAEDVYRVTTLIEKGGDKEKYSSAPPALTYRMEEEIPDIYKSVHIDANFHTLINHQGNNISTYGYFTEPSFFDVFGFKLQAGAPEVLNSPGQVILTKELATKLYGNQEAVGKVLESEKWGQLQVSGVLEDFPIHTHLAFDILVGFPTSAQFNASYKANSWDEFTNNYYYFAVQDHHKDNVFRQMTEIGKNGDAAFEKTDATAAYGTQALLDITPGEMLNDGIGIQFDMPTMILFIGISLLILIPACFNYTNMSIALALKRAKEVGIRKVMGSHRKPIIYQFLVETVIICLISVLLSSIAFTYMRQSFMEMLAGGSSLSFALTPGLVLAFIGFAVITGILTGLAPAIYFAKISPIQALRSNASTGKVSITGLRKGLLVFQFALTLIFMIGIGALLKQYQETKSFELPFDTNNTFVVYTQDTDIDLINNYLQKEPAVSELSFSSSMPGTSLTKSIYSYNEELQDSLRIREVYVNDQFMDHMNLTLLWGQKLNNQKHQVEQVVANQEAIARLKKMKFDTTFITLEDDKRAQIVGVIENYNHEPLNESMEPMILRIDQNKLNYALVTIPDGDPMVNYSILEKQWDTINPDIPFKASLLQNEIYEAYYFFRVGLRIFGFLAFLAVSISCLGLLGMVIYTTENRTKEVAIRKILGASKQSLFGSLAQLFIKLWTIALIIAVPLSYLFYDKVLISMYNKFSDGVGFVEIFISVVVTLSLGGMAIFWQVNKIARINPASNLRND